MAYLELAGLEKRYRDAVAVADVTLAVEKGGSVALLGPSGCGKTTTLRMLAGLVAPDQGRINVDGADITTMPAHKRNMGYVFQSYALFPHMTVEKNVAFGLEERGVAAKERKERVATALDTVHLNELSHRRPRELSGGQQQRVALARALVIRPTVLLLDESLSNLDAKLRQTMRREIRDLQRSLAITTLFVTHDQVEALAMCDRIAVMNRGRIEQVGTPNDVYERPATRFVASFVGSVNVLPASRDASGNLVVWGNVIPAARPPAVGNADVFVRPQRMRLVAASESVAPGVPHLQGKVEQNIFIGDQLETVVAGAEGQLTVQSLSGGEVPAAGTDVKVVWKPEDTLVFPREAS
jgi:putative spermidine/putrescine transport system ATP-binding protein